MLRDATHYSGVVIRTPEGTKINIFVIPRNRPEFSVRFPGGTDKFRWFEAPRQTAFRQANLKVGGTKARQHFWQFWRTKFVKIGRLMHVQRVGEAHIQYFFSAELLRAPRKEGIPNDERDWADDPSIPPGTWLSVGESWERMTPNHKRALGSMRERIFSVDADDEYYYSLPYRVLLSTRLPTRLIPQFILSFLVPSDV